MRSVDAIAAAVLLATAMAIGCGETGAPAPAGTTAARPNVVFVLTDDQRWDAISLQGNSGPLETPNIDRLGREGVY